MVATCAATAAPSLRSYSPCRRMGSRYFWCSCSGGRVDRPGGREAPRLLKIAVSGVTELLRLLPAAPRKERENSGGREEGPPIRSIEDVVSVLRSDYEKAYFLTGNFTSEIYSEGCLFEDPTLKFYGRDRYSQNLDLLVQFFDRPSLVLEKIEKDYKIFEMLRLRALVDCHFSNISTSYIPLNKCADNEREFVLATWFLRTYLRLPWMPLIRIGGTTTYDLDDNFRIVRHAERWNVSALEAVGQIFTPSRNNGR